MARPLGMSSIHLHTDLPKFQNRLSFMKMINVLFVKKTQGRDGNNNKNPPPPRKDGSQNQGLFAHFYMPLLNLKGLIMQNKGSYIIYK